MMGRGEERCWDCRGNLAAAGVYRYVRGRDAIAIQPNLCPSDKAGTKELNAGQITRSCWRYRSCTCQCPLRNRGVRNAADGALARRWTGNDYLGNVRGFYGAV